MTAGTDVSKPTTSSIPRSFGSARVKPLGVMSEAEQVAVRPTIALLILHRLVRELIGAAICIPATNGVAQAATPAAHGVHVFGEVEQVRADAADLAHVPEGVELRVRNGGKCW